jgi:drug/metabolite transporter (DMT)-like permease
MLVAAWRLLPSGALLLAWASAKGSKGPSSAMGWFAVALFGLVDGACFQGFLAEGLQRTSAGLGSVIIDSQPLSVAVISSILFGETLGPVALVGLLLGVGGLVLLEVPPDALGTFPMTRLSSIEFDTSGSVWDSGEWWMLLAAQSMAVGTVMVRWVSKYSDPIAATGWHMILGGIPLALLAVKENSGTSLVDVFSGLDAKDYLLLMYVSVLGSAASYGVFFYLATVRGSLTRLSSLTFLTPMFAAVGGYIVLGESLTSLQLAGALVTLIGVTCINTK